MLYPQRLGRESHHVAVSGRLVRSPVDCPQSRFVADSDTQAEYLRIARFPQFGIAALFQDSDCFQRSLDISDVLLLSCVLLHLLGTGRNVATTIRAIHLSSFPSTSSCSVWQSHTVPTSTSAPHSRHSTKRTH